MPRIRSGITVTEPNTTYGSGRSDKAARMATYASSPIYRGELTETTLKQIYEDTTGITTGVISDGGYLFGTVSRNYADTPDLGTVDSPNIPVGGGGLPGGPFYPNIAPPGEGNGVNYAAIPADGAFPRQPTNLYGVGSGIKTPAATTRGIVPRTLSTVLQPGVGSGDTFAAIRETI